MKSQVMYKNKHKFKMTILIYNLTSFVKKRLILQKLNIYLIKMK